MGNRWVEYRGESLEVGDQPCEARKKASGIEDHIRLLKTFILFERGSTFDRKVGVGCHDVRRIC